MRFFFRSFRYSEDMDLDIERVSIGSLKDTVMKILKSISFQDALKPFGIESVIPPDIEKAKQTETTQRFKIHLITSSGEDLFTKIEFSRRGIKEGIAVASVSDQILRGYKLLPLIVPHYDLPSMVNQKINALAMRPVVQARDIFDLYILNSQYDNRGKMEVMDKRSSKANENIFEVSFEQFRDTVISYLSIEDQGIYNSHSVWDEIKLKVSNFIDEIGKKDG